MKTLSTHLSRTSGDPRAGAYLSTNFLGNSESCQRIRWPVVGYVVAARHVGRHVAAAELLKNITRVQIRHRKITQRNNATCKIRASPLLFIRGKQQTFRDLLFVTELTSSLRSSLL